MRFLLTTLFSIFFSLSAASETLYVKKTEDGYLNLREGPGVQYRIIRRIYPGDRVESYESNGTWRKVESGGGVEPWATGWVSAKFLETDLVVGRTLNIAPTPDGYLNLRTGPGTKYQVIRRIYPGDRVQMLDATGSWRYVELENGVQGWAHSLYMEDGEVYMEPQPLSE